MRKHKISNLFSAFMAISIFIIPLFYSHHYLESSENGNINIRLVKVIGRNTEDIQANDPYLFFSIYSLSCDTEGNIYVLDNKDISIKIFDKNGNFVRKILREGRGPEEIEVPYEIAINRYKNDHLFVLHMHGYELKEFTRDGEYVKTYSLPFQIAHFFDFIDMERLIFVSTTGDERIGIINLSSLKLEKGFASLAPVPSVTYGLQRFVVKDGILWTCHGDNVELTGYDFETGKEKVKIPIPEKYEKHVIEKHTSWWAARLRQYAQPIVLNNALYVLFSRWEWTSDNPAQEKNLELSLYQLRGRELKKVGELPEARFMRLGATWQNRLILYGNNPYPQVKIFELFE